MDLSERINRRRTHEATEFGGVTLVLTTVALAASYIPALRAMRVDPITTLHSE